MLSTFAQLSVIVALAFASHSVRAAAVAIREDVTDEVYVGPFLLALSEDCSPHEPTQITEGQDLTQFCACWNRECIQ